MKIEYIGKINCGEIYEYTCFHVEKRNLGNPVRKAHL